MKLKQARAIIVSTMSNRQLEYIKNLKSAHSVISEFDSIYLNQSTSLQIICRSKLNDIEYTKFNSSKAFLMNLKNCAII